MARALLLLVIATCAPARSGTLVDPRVLRGEGSGRTVAEAHAAALADVALQARAEVVAWTTSRATTLRRGDATRTFGTIARTIETSTWLSDGGLARRASVREGNDGLMRVVVELDRTRAAMRLRARGAALRAELVAARVATPSSDLVLAWDRARKQKAAARRLLALELEATAIDGDDWALGPAIERALQTEAAARQAASQVSCDVQLSGDPSLARAIEATCASALSPDGTRRLGLRGTVTHRSRQDAGLTWIEHACALELYAGDRLLAYLIVPPSSSLAVLRRKTLEALERHLWALGSTR